MSSTFSTPSLRSRRNSTTARLFSTPSVKPPITGTRTTTGAPGGDHRVEVAAAHVNVAAKDLAAAALVHNLEVHVEEVDNPQDPLEQRRRLESSA